VQQFQPTVTDLYELKKNGDKVGYANGSFVYDLLIDQGFDKNNIIAFDSAEECDELLSNGTAKGGIAAAIDETPNMKIFYAQYCSKYTMIGPILKTDGFGFVFPKGSPLVGDISRAILNLTEGEEMKKIENKWLMDNGNCPLDSQPSISSSSLSLDSFWGLFLIAGVASLSALLIFAGLFIYKHRHILLLFNSETSIWRRIGDMFRTFDQRYMSSHTFRKSEGNDSVHDTAIVMGSPTNTIFPPSPTIYSGSSTPFHGDLGTPRLSPQVAPTTIELITIPNQESSNS
jgi:ionotropic glutamate receptor